MTHTKTTPRRTQLLFGAFVLTAAIGLNSASAIRARDAQEPSAYLLRSVSSSTSSVSTSSVSSASASSRSRVSLFQSRNNIRSRRIVKPLRRRVNSGALLHQAASSSSRVPIKATCGDKLTTYGEQCDDGNIVANDGCSATCQVETGFTCDNSQPSLCWTRCGDGIRAAVEKCDDGNITAGDGCNAVCKIEFFYICTGSPSSCSIPAICGDSNVSEDEECDDGNTSPGDGCSSTCTDE
jgi:cysteine-rich repeat protein